jgi:4-hydroxy-tetrahydrodipicolinate synthase
MIMSRFSAELIPAMVTPFKRDGALDLIIFKKLMEHLIENDCDGLLVNGTTGESPTLIPAEKIELIEVALDFLKNKTTQLVSGVGSNDTERSIQDAKAVFNQGVETLLLLTPYYNKPSQNGLFEHFKQVAYSVKDAEIILYNIPGRCGVKILPETMWKLHQVCPNIIGVKQSVADMDDASDIASRLSDKDWLIWSGDDSLTLPMMACGKAHGVISVLAHLTGKQIRAMILAFKQGNIAKAQALHLTLFNLARDMFFLPNPTVVKTCLAELGVMNSTFRLPIVPPDAEEMKRIQTILKELQSVSERPLLV